MPALPMGTITYLFTDIEGSTTLWDLHPTAARAALLRHDVLIEEIAAAQDGVVVKPRGEGDSRFAVFARATDAVTAAAEMQQALHAEPWSTPTPLRVRMAMHTGEADLREGDYYGSAVNRCARLRGVAHGGQSLVSAITYGLVRDELPAGVSLRDLGEHRLKDLIRPEHIYQMVVPQVPSDFPPLKTVNSRAVSEGLAALGELMWVSTAREAVVAFRTDFQAARIQIDALADYKQLHDQFQQLEDRYHLIFHDVKSLPGDETAWLRLERCETDLEALVDTMLEVAVRPSVIADTAAWRPRLDRVRTELQTAVENAQFNQLRSATAGLNGIIGRELSRVNTRLISAAGSLRLATLVETLGTIRDRLGELHLDSQATRQMDAFAQGVESLARLEQSLRFLIDMHNTFQQLDDELRRVEATMNQDLHEIEYAWPDLKLLMERLCRASETDWATKLEAIGGELEQVLAGENPVKLTRAFRSYRSQAIRGFNRVDRELLGLCGELQTVGEPLAAMLRLIG